MLIFNVIEKMLIFYCIVQGSTYGNVKSCKVRLFNDNIVERNFMLPNIGKTMVPKKIHDCPTLYVD